MMGIKFPLQSLKLDNLKEGLHLIFNYSYLTSTSDNVKLINTYNIILLSDEIYEMF